MHINIEDLTLKRDYILSYRFLISECELVKKKQYFLSTGYVKEFYQVHHTDFRAVLKYYTHYR